MDSDSLCVLHHEQSEWKMGLPIDFHTFCAIVGEPVP